MPSLLLHVKPIDIQIDLLYIALYYAWKRISMSLDSNNCMFLQMMLNYGLQSFVTSLLKSPFFLTTTSVFSALFKAYFLRPEKRRTSLWKFITSQ